MLRSKLFFIARAIAVGTALAGSLATAALARNMRSSGDGTATVPTLTGLSLPAAYDELHRDGFRVSFAPSFSVDWSDECVPVIAGSTPRSGDSIPPNSTIRVATRTPPCAVASPAPPVPLPGPVRVLSFVGKRLSTAIRWVERHHLSWSATVPQLTGGDAPSVYANFTITGQVPRPGSKLAAGMDRHGGWLPTPLRLKVKPSSPGPAARNRLGAGGRPSTRLRRPGVCS